MKQNKILVVTAEVILRYDGLSDQSYAAGYRASKLIDRDEVLGADSYEVKKIKSARWIKKKQQPIVCEECGNSISGRYVSDGLDCYHIDCYVAVCTSAEIVEAPDAK